MAIEKSPIFVVIYQGLDLGEEITLGEEIIESAGTGFTVGIVGGSLYHFGKALLKRQNIITGVNAARANSPRVGGAVALAYLPVYTVRHIFGGGGRRQEHDLWLGHIASLAAVAGLLWAPRGLGSAARAAFVGGLIPASIVALSIYTENCPLFNQQRPYSYPHYRLHQQQDQ